jgi:hypothetical protein
MQIPIDELRNLVKITDFDLLIELCDNCKKQYDNYTSFIISFFNPDTKDLALIIPLTDRVIPRKTSGVKWGAISIFENYNWAVNHDNLFDVICGMVGLTNSDYEIKVLDRREWITYLHKITGQI